MSRTSIGYGPVLLLAFGLGVGMTTASSACSKATGEGQTTRSQPASPDPASPAGDRDMKPGAPSTSKSSIDILGFGLGGPYQDAVAAAGDIELKEDTPEDHRGKGQLHGMRAEVTLAGRHGRLADIQLRLQLEQADQALDSSQPFTRLVAALGQPSEVSGDVARWHPAGFEVLLQRHSVWAKGEDAPRIEYTLRGRAVPVEGGAADPAEQQAKDREAGN